MSMFSNGDVPKVTRQAGNKRSRAAVWFAECDSLIHTENDSSRRTLQSDSDR